ncbi:MAG: hypothetical protein HPZ91_11520 [Lentisphaeria bacterium]|nr:hypothetical protein [Lentisphaeria bacterium]
MRISHILPAALLYGAAFLSAAGMSDEQFAEACRAAGPLPEAIAALPVELGEEYFLRRLVKAEGADFRNTMILYDSWWKAKENQAYLELLAALSGEEKVRLAREERMWRRELSGRAGRPDFGDNAANRSLAELYLQESSIRRSRNRRNCLLLPAEQRAAVRNIVKNGVMFRGEKRPFVYCELEMPVGRSRKSGKTIVESVAVLLTPYCRELRLDGDVYQIGVIVPVADSPCDDTARGRERNLCVWRNGLHISTWQLPPGCGIADLKTDGGEIVVTLTPEAARNGKETPARTLRFPLRTSNRSPLVITHAINSDGDGK